MRIEEWDQIHDIVAWAVEEVFESLSVPVKYLGTRSIRDAHWAETLALIGLGGKLRGSLVLSAPVAVVSRSHPSHSNSADEVNDWLAELVNLMLGRIKARLYAFSVQIELSTPLTISAVAFRFERFAGTPVVHEFEVGDERVLVVFEAVAEPNLRLIAPRGESVIEPGEVVTF